MTIEPARRTRGVEQEREAELEERIEGFLQGKEERMTEGKKLPADG